MSDHPQVKIAAAKGRPMLTWVGKRPIHTVPAYPAQHIETFTPCGPDQQGGPAPSWWPTSVPTGGLLYHGDNKEVLAHLLATGFRGKVNLIYIDPPFDSGADYVRKVSLRGPKGAAKMQGESYTLGEQVQYTDIWANDNYLQFMYERLMLLYELMSDTGTLYLHCDDTKVHLLRCLLDEVFGSDNFMNEVLWLFRERGISKTTWNRKHNNILVYTKRRGQQVFNVDTVRDDYSEVTKSKFKYRDENGCYQIRGRNIPGSPVRQADGLRPEHEKQYPGLTYRQYLQNGQLPVDWWEIPLVNKAATDRTDYPTQKPEELLYRSILASSNPGDLVLDCFVGSGTTAAVAQKLGRRWVACDINLGAVQTTSKRLQAIIREQVDARTPNGQAKLMDSEDALPEPAQLSFTVWRVNDYDLQVQHNEAVELACAAIGVQRTRSDSFFAGTRGDDTLVRVIPFNHPLNALDLDEIRRELDARPGEDRNVVVVSLGKELASDAWLEEYNRLRRGPSAANRIEVIELRTDARYGGFLQHEPAVARATITRQGAEIAVTIEDFCSPTIVKRLQSQTSIVTAHIDDWRQMVDCVMIDAAFNGEVFNVVLSDVPMKKTDFVAGTYSFPAPEGVTTVAVKIVDMLGEEVLVTGEV